MKIIISFQIARIPKGYRKGRSILTKHKYEFDSKLEYDIWFELFRFEIKPNEKVIQFNYMEYI